MSKVRRAFGATAGVALLLVATLGTEVSSQQDAKVAGEAQSAPGTSRSVFRDKTTGELFEQLPDGTYRRYHGTVIPHATGNEVIESFRSHLGADLSNALDAAPRAGPQPPKQEPSASKTLECILDEMPGVQTDLAAQAILARCKERNKGESGNKSSWLAHYDSPSDCVAGKAKETRSEAGVRLIVAACRGLYAGR